MHSIIEEFLYNTIDQDQEVVFGEVKKLLEVILEEIELAFNDEEYQTFVENMIDKVNKRGRNEI